MAGRENLTSILKEVFKKSPVESNVVFSFILIVLEKMVEWEFECPCNPKINLCLALAYFIVPTFIIILLMILVIQECIQENFSLIIFPAFIWLNLVFSDGKYFACAGTNWSGKYVTVSGSSHFKWCQPFNETLTEEYLKKTQGWFSVSQIIGIWSLLFTAIGYVIYKKCREDTDTRERIVDSSRYGSCPGFMELKPPSH